MNPIFKRYFLPSAIVISTMISQQSWPSSTVAPIHQFPALNSSNTNVGGAQPQTLILGTDGLLYGTTRTGGPDGQGTLYSMSTAGSGFKVLRSFCNKQCGGVAPGAVPHFLTEGADGFLYGLTERGGFSTYNPSGLGGTQNDSNHGTLYKIHRDGTSFSVIHNFCSTTAPSSPCSFSKGFAPQQIVIQPDGTIYGTTLSGGSSDQGVVFKITPAGTYSVIHTLSVFTAGGDKWPKILLDGKDGFLYGTAENSVFRISDAGAFTKIASFAPSIGRPESLLLADDGNLYGTTSTIFFRLSRSGALTTLRNFGAGTGVFVLKMQGADRRLYGIYAAASTSLDGTINRISLDGLIFENLYSFSPRTPNASGGTNSDGVIPSDFIASNDGNFFAAMKEGGTAGAGSIIKVTHPAPAVSIAASPVEILSGQSSTITWTSTESIACTASGAWSGARPINGALAVTPASSGVHSYSLTCTGAGGTSTTASTSVHVNIPPPAPTVRIESQPEVPTGMNVGRLEWSSSNTNNCSASGNWSGTKPTSGNMGLNFAVAGRYTYTLTCTNSGGTTSASWTVNVIQAPISTIAVAPTTIDLGESATLTWTYDGDGNCEGYDAWNGPKSLNGSAVVSPPSTGDYSYILSCSGAAGSIARLTVLPAPIVIPTTDSAGSTGGGGGSLNSYFLLLMATCGLALHRRRKFGEAD